MFLALIAIILTLFLVVGIHESGHAVLARYFNVKIKKISLGFGRPLFSWRADSGCEWVWAIWPLGGYVQLENSRISPVKSTEYPYCFDKKPIWQRVLILLAGAIANIITAWCALVVVYSIGLSYSLPQIKSVQPNSIAARMGIVAGDQFVAIAGHSTPSWNEVGMRLIIAWGKKEVPVTLSQDNGKKLKEITLDLNKIPFQGVKLTLLTLLGMEPDLSAAHGRFYFPFIGDAIEQANATVVNMFYFFLIIFKQLFSGIIPFSMLLGPLSLFAASVASLNQGISMFLFFIANLSLAVALVNLFPVPGLDGGSVMYALIERVRGKPVSVAMEILVHRLVFIVFCVVLVHLLMNDLQRI